MAAPAQEGSSWFSSFTDKFTGMFSDSPEKIQKEYDECISKCSEKKKTREDKLNGTGKSFYQIWGGKRRRTKRRTQKGGDYMESSAGSSLKFKPYNTSKNKKHATNRRTQRGGNVQPNISQFTAGATEIAPTAAPPAKQTGGKRRKSSKKGRK